jgi:prophage maintenance system killer protein
MSKKNQPSVTIYKGPRGEVEVRLAGETVWLSLNQMASLFGRDKSVISRHLSGIFRARELDRDSVVADFATTAADGKTYRVDHYNLDAILSVGYRVNSRQGTRFRQWATRTLNEHLTRGFTIQRQRFEQNARELEAALAMVRRVAGSEALTSDQGRGLVDVIARYTQTFILLQRYDEGLLTEPKGSPGGDLRGHDEAMKLVAEVKASLMVQGEAGALFGQERAGGLASILGNLDQSAFGEPAYPSIESKAAHLLYFVIKNHPFSDGNKRIASLLFVDFLNRNGRLLKGGAPVINDIGLAALALLVAESNPKDKDTMVRLIINMLAGAD